MEPKNFREMTAILSVHRASTEFTVDNQMRNPKFRRHFAPITGEYDRSAHHYPVREIVRGAILLNCYDVGLMPDDLPEINSALNSEPVQLAYDPKEPASLSEPTGLDAIISAAKSGEEIELVISYEPSGNPVERNRISAAVMWSTHGRTTDGNLAAIRIHASRLIKPLLGA